MNAENIRVTFSEDGEIAGVMDIARVDGDNVQCTYERADIIYPQGIIAACVVALACAVDVHKEVAGAELLRLVRELTEVIEKKEDDQPF